MGFGLGSFFDPFGIIGTNDAGSQAATAQVAGNREAIGEIRRQFDVTQGNIDPFIQAGAGALPDFSGGATLEGFGERLRQLFSGGTLDPLLDERQREVESSLSARGLNRSGTAIRELADIPTQLGLQIENLLFNRSANVAGSGQNAALGLGSLGAQSSGNIAGLQSESGRAIGSGIVTDAQADAAQTEQLLQIGAIVASFFSDPNLKRNTRVVGQVRFSDESKNLTIHEWEWIPEAQDTIVAACPTKGFMADQVKEKYPHHVYRHAGFDTIDYQSLLNELEELNEMREAA